MVIQAIFPQILRPHCNTLLFHRCDIPQKRQGYPLLNIVFPSLLFRRLHTTVWIGVIKNHFLNNQVIQKQLLEMFSEHHATTCSTKSALRIGWSKRINVQIVELLYQLINLFEINYEKKDFIKYNKFS